MHQINVSLVFATVERQWIYESKVARGTSAQELIESSGFMSDLELLSNQEIDNLEIGVFSEKVSADYFLQEGDRVEIYRPLTADPKEARRQLASMGKTMGKK